MWETAQGLISHPSVKTKLVAFSAGFERGVGVGDECKDGVCWNGAKGILKGAPETKAL